VLRRLLNKVKRINLLSQKSKPSKTDFTKLKKKYTLNTKEPQKIQHKTINNAKDAPKPIVNSRM
jgi:hypothetical protein